MELEEALKVLGLDRLGPIEDVKSSYRDLVKETHPDQGGERQAFEKVRKAYRVVMEEYDTGGPIICENKLDLQEMYKEKVSIEVDGLQIEYKPLNLDRIRLEYEGREVEISQTISIDDNFDLLGNDVYQLTTNEKVMTLFGELVQVGRPVSHIEGRGLTNGYQQGDYYIVRFST